MLSWAILKCSKIAMTLKLLSLKMLLILKIFDCRYILRWHLISYKYILYYCDFIQLLNVVACTVWNLAYKDPKIQTAVLEADLHQVTTTFICPQCFKNYNDSSSNSNVKWIIVNLSTLIFFHFFKRILSGFALHLYDLPLYIDFMHKLNDDIVRLIIFIGIIWHKVD